MTTPKLYTATWKNTEVIVFDCGDDYFYGLAPKIKHQFGDFRKNLTDLTEVRVVPKDASVLQDVDPIPVREILESASSIVGSRTGYIGVKMKLDALIAQLTPSATTESEGGGEGMSETLENHKHDWIHSVGFRGDLDCCWDCNATQPCDERLTDCQYRVDLPMRPRGTLNHPRGTLNNQKEVEVPVTSCPCHPSPTYTASQLNEKIEALALKVERVKVPTEGVTSDQNQAMYFFKGDIARAIREAKI